MTKKNIIFLSISLVLIILLGIGVSYSMWNISVSQDTNNTAYTECFDLSITNKENNINLDNAYPISNDKGKSLTPYTFTVTNTCDITAEYSVNLEVLKDSTLSSKFIDVMFEGNINLLSSYDSTDKVNASSIESRKLTYGILKSRESKDYSLRLWIDYNTTLEDLNNEIKTFKSKIVVVGKPINYTGDTVFNFDYTGAEQTFVAPVSGTYKVETWGASGGGANDYIGGLGGYVSGNIKLYSNQNLYAYVGENPSYTSTSCYSYNPNSSFNGSTVGNCSGGGGATDIRIVRSDNWYDFLGIKSRIMVSAGGGGAIYKGHGGSGGGLIGYDGYGFSTIVNSYEIGKGGTQNSSIFGVNKTSETTIGGGGYYNGNLGYAANSGGGSSFISGHNGCDAIKEESTEDNIIHTGQSIHYSGYYFTNTLMIDGEGYRWTTKKEEQIGMPSHSDNSIIMGNSGNGYARITLVSIEE